MIQRCTDTNFAEIYKIINQAAQVYRGVIPPDRWHDPYMPESELQAEIASGVEFWAELHDSRILGVMGYQPVKDVVLIRHAYVLPDCQRLGVGGRLLAHLTAMTDRPILIGTWAAADWAIRFYQKHGFFVVDTQEKNRLLATYWNIPDRQIETSVVLRIYNTRV